MNRGLLRDGRSPRRGVDAETRRRVASALLLSSRRGTYVFSEGFRDWTTKRPRRVAHCRLSPFSVSGNSLLTAYAVSVVPPARVVPYSYCLLLLARLGGFRGELGFRRRDGFLRRRRGPMERTRRMSRGDGQKGRGRA